MTANYFTAQKFLDEVDAAAVYVNASTRFTDGFEFGLGRRSASPHRRCTPGAPWGWRSSPAPNTSSTAPARYGHEPAVPVN